MNYQEQQIHYKIGLNNVIKEKINNIPDTITLTGDISGFVKLSGDTQVYIDTKLKDELSLLNNNVNWNTILEIPESVRNFNPDDYVKYNEYQDFITGDLLNNFSNVKIQWSQILNPPNILSSNADLVTIPYFIQYLNLISSKFDNYVLNLSNKVTNLSNSYQSLHLPTERRISLSGVINGEAFFDGSKDIVIETSFSDLSFLNINSQQNNQSSTEINIDNLINNINNLSESLSNISVDWKNIINRPAFFSTFNFDESYITYDAYNEGLNTLSTTLLTVDIPILFTNYIENSQFLSSLVDQRVNQIYEKSDKRFLTLHEAANYFLPKTDTIKYANVINAPTKLSQFTNDVPYVSASQLSQYALKSEVKTNDAFIPTKTSDLTNDSGFLTEHQDLSDYAKINWVLGQGYLSELPDLNKAGYATQQWVKNQGYLSAHQSLAQYVKKDELNGYAKNWDIPVVPEYISSFKNNVGYIRECDLNGYATEQWVINQKYVKNLPSLDAYATKDWVKNQGYLTTHQSLDKYATKDWANNRFLTSHQSLAGYATQQWVKNQGYLSGHQSLTGYATQQWVKNQKYVTQVPSLAGYATQQWVKNQGYLTNVPQTEPTYFGVPDFSKEIRLYSAMDDPNGRGYRIMHFGSSTSKEAEAIIFKLCYPCFIYSEVASFDDHDTDLLLEMSNDWKTCVLAQGESAKQYTACRYYAWDQGNRWVCFINICSDGTQNPFLMPLGTIGWWYHYAAGANGSSDSGDNSQWRHYTLLPMYGTPSGKKLAEVYKITYGSFKARYDNTNDRVYINRYKEGATPIKIKEVKCP